MSMAAGIIAAAFGGSALGFVHFAALEMQVHALAGRQGLLRTALPMLRFALTGGGLYLCVRAGAAPLAAAMLGFLIARAMMLRGRVGRA
jgi:F1F0 ATPase subunit 2